uniref:Uncharacterized protein n=1 Tax=Plectus sambesii TaxID=2011161 RepID=A0A914XH06_9BILA
MSTRLREHADGRKEAKMGERQMRTASNFFFLQINKFDRYRRLARQISSETCRLPAAKPPLTALADTPVWQSKCRGTAGGSGVENEGDCVESWRRGG